MKSKEDMVEGGGRGTIARSLNSGVTVQFARHSGDDCASIELVGLRLVDGTVEFKHLQ